MKLRIQRLSHREKIKGQNDLTVSDFWSWAYSDLMSNANRSVFAEFLVASALGVLDKPRIEWDAYDLEYNGKKIEVKCSAYLQSWKQNGLSQIRFNISKKRSWHFDSNTFEDGPVRSADCYVFCVYTETDPEKVNVLDVDAWQFYVTSKEKIEADLGNQKSVGIKKFSKCANLLALTNLKQELIKFLKKVQFRGTSCNRTGASLNPSEVEGHCTGQAPVK